MGSPTKIISIIIPVAQGEELWRGLVSQLSPHLEDIEILLCSPEPSPFSGSTDYQWVQTPAGRAWQMNQGAFSASGKYFWFLHADSRISHEALSLIKKQLDNLKFGYFSLKFRGAYPLMKINEIGANFRSQVFGMPFGDQGFIIERSTFFKLGGYDTSLPFAEDHLLVWKAHQQAIPLTHLQSSLATSARKYLSRGWLKTTLTHLYYTYKQAIPEALRLMKKQNQKPNALAIFVKTPDISQVKTRLAQDLSGDLAKSFFLKSVRAVEEISSLCDGLDIYWSVAESTGLTHPLWQSRPRLWQGVGLLGDRQHATYQQLIHRYNKVLFVGSDCPQLEASLIRETLSMLDLNDFVLGPASDGGYYLLGGKRDIPRPTWLKVMYSEASTCQQLSQELKKMGSLHFLEVLTDVDNLLDLKAAKQQLEKIEHKSPSQKDLVDWIDAVT